MPNGFPFPDVEGFEVCEIEIAPYARDLRLQIAAQVREDPEAEEATTIVRSDQTWYVDVFWDLTGVLAHHLCGTFCVCLFLESVGPGPEYGGDDRFCVEIKMKPCKEEYKEKEYHHTFEIEPGLIKAGECGTLYLIGVTLSSKDPCGDPGHIAGYCRGPSVMVYPGPEPDKHPAEEGAEA